MPLQTLVDFVELYFILNSETSSLDLLPYEQSKRYKNFSWHYHDFYGEPIGPNESLTKEMLFNLNQIRPERRPNTGKTAIVTKSKFKELEKYIIGELRNIPDFPSGSGYTQPSNKKLNQYALKDFLLMRAAALKDLVPLIVLSSDRSAEKAARNAARAGNPTKVAKFSVHMLGLAMDLKMGYKIGENTRKYREISTTPMQNVVDMRQSPVHKWMFIHGEKYGWYPFQHEPWHWEYNPPGFQQKFFSNLKSL